MKAGNVLYHGDNLDILRGSAPRFSKSSGTRAS